MTRPAAAHPASALAALATASAWRGSGSDRIAPYPPAPLAPVAGSNLPLPLGSSPECPTHLSLPGFPMHGVVVGGGVVGGDVVGGAVVGGAVVGGAVVGGAVVDGDVVGGAVVGGAVVGGDVVGGAVVGGAVVGGDVVGGAVGGGAVVGGAVGGGVVVSGTVVGGEVVGSVVVGGLDAWAWAGATMLLMRGFDHELGSTRAVATPPIMTRKTCRRSCKSLMKNRPRVQKIVDWPRLRLLV